MPCSLPISESSDSLSPEVVMPTAPATELDATQQRQNEYKRPMKNKTYIVMRVKVLLVCS